MWRYKFLVLDFLSNGPYWNIFKLNTYYIHRFSYYNSHQVLSSNTTSLISLSTKKAHHVKLTLPPTIQATLVVRNHLFIRLLTTNFLIKIYHFIHSKNKLAIINCMESVSHSHKNIQYNVTRCYICHFSSRVVTCGLRIILK